MIFNTAPGRFPAINEREAMNIQMLIWSILAAFCLSACTKPDHAARVLESAGYTDIQMHGYVVFGCSEDDQYHDKFTAKGPTGKPVSGVVCAGLVFKGATIRLD